MMRQWFKLMMKVRALNNHDITSQASPYPKS